MFASVSTYLEPYMTEVKKDKESRVRKFVNEAAPEYRWVLHKKPEILDEIPADFTPDKLDVLLLRQERELEIELQTEYTAAVKMAEESPEALGKISEYYTRVFNSLNDHHKSKLAKYVLMRREVLHLLDRAIRYKKSTEHAYFWERTIHQLICPMKRTSEDLEYRHQNLWVLDERLVYHSLLLSDRPINSAPELLSDSGRKPDILTLHPTDHVWDNRLTYGSGEGADGIVVVEFKRPGRDDYTPGENPVFQVLRQIREIRAGNKKDMDGRRIRPSFFYCYIVCDITPSLRPFLDEHEFQPLPDDEEGCFKVFSQHQAYVEVITFEKMIRDATRRNTILFKQLNLPIMPDRIDL